MSNRVTPFYVKGCWIFKTNNVSKSSITLFCLFLLRLFVSVCFVVVFVSVAAGRKRLHCGHGNCNRCQQICFFSTIVLSLAKILLTRKTGVCVSRIIVIGRVSLTFHPIAMVYCVRQGCSFLKDLLCVAALCNRGLVLYIYF